MVLYGQLLGEVPHDRRVQEGLLLAARGTGDCTQLSQVWQQVRAYNDGEIDIELQSVYERLMSKTRAVCAAAAPGGVYSASRTSITVSPSRRVACHVTLMAALTL